MKKCYSVGLLHTEVNYSNKYYCAALKEDIFDVLCVILLLFIVMLLIKWAEACL